VQRSRLRPAAGIVLVAAALAQPASWSPVVLGVSPNIVVSQIYGGGGNAGATYTHDFVELHNSGPAAASLSGLSIQYASATGTGSFGANSGQLAELPDVTLQPGQYFLIQLAGGTTGLPLPAPDLVDPTPINMSGSAGKVALVTGITSLGCNGGSTPCPADALARIVDLVGYGNANFFEGSPVPALSNTTAAIRTTGEIDTDVNSADFTVAAPNPRNSGGGGGTPTISVNDASVAEGDAGTVTLTFTVTLSRAAPAGGVFFQIATGDGSALAGEDYEAVALQGSIAEGSSSASVPVTIHGDTTIEPNETFTVTLSSLSGADAGDLSGTGTILNDDVTVIPIHELQGPGAISPYAGQDVATTGIVTARKSNGFFLQTPEADADALAETSEGVFVFTSSTPTIAVGDSVRVSGRVAEFRRTDDALPGTLTEITTPAVTVLSSGHALPAPVDLAALPASAPTRNLQLERFEGMRASVASLTVVGPTNGFGELYGVVPGVARPFREPGIDVNDIVPPEAPPAVPRFDGNHERIMVDTGSALDALGTRRSALPLSTGAGVEGIAGPLDYAFDTYRVVLDAGAGTVAAPGRVAGAVPAPAAGEFTVAALNVQNFFAPGPGANDAQIAAFQARLTKATRVIVDVLRTPAILGLIEMGDINALRQLRDRVNLAAGTAYEAYLLEADPDNTPNDQDVGYLVDLARVVVRSEPFQVYQGLTFEIGGATDILFDRPPFVLEARANGVDVTVILNHLKSLIDVNSFAPNPGSTGGVTVGQRNRLKRRLGAERVADLIQSRQGENLIVLGDMNAFEFNDGFVDVVGTLLGSPAPAGEVTEPSVDAWSHTLVNLAGGVDPSERYSYVFDGNAQVLDHVLVNQAMLSRLTRFAYARVNADFPAAFSSDPGRPERLSDHDAPVAYFAALADANVALAGGASLPAGGQAALVMSVGNAGPDTAEEVVATATLPAGVAVSTITAPEGWTCESGGSTVTCRTASLVPASMAAIPIGVTVACGSANGTPLSFAAAVVSSTADASAGNDTAAFSTLVENPSPSLTAPTVDHPVLWLPLHQMVTVRVSYTATDTCGSVATSLSVTSDEPVVGAGQGLAGLTSPDWEVLDTTRVRLRAERSISGDGRVYTIAVTAVDSAGGTTTRTVTVRVPRPIIPR
jgi:predicted extracellular nuclease